MKKVQHVSMAVVVAVVVVLSLGIWQPVQAQQYWIWLYSNDKNPGAWIGYQHAQNWWEWDYLRLEHPDALPPGMVWGYAYLVDHINLIGAFTYFFEARGATVRALGEGTIGISEGPDGSVTITGPFDDGSMVVVTPYGDVVVHVGCTCDSLTYDQAIEIAQQGWPSDAWPADYGFEGPEAFGGSEAGQAASESQDQGFE